MLWYIGRRVLQMIPVFLGATLLIYAMVFLLFAASIAFNVYGAALLQALHGLSPLCAGYVVGSESLGWTCWKEKWFQKSRRGCQTVTYCSCSGNFVGSAAALNASTARIAAASAPSPSANGRSAANIRVRATAAVLTALATSSGDIQPRFAGVSSTDGSTALTRIPCCARSVAAHLVRCSTPALATA